MSVKDALSSGSATGRQCHQPPRIPREPHTPRSYAALHLLLPRTTLQTLAPNSSLRWQFPGRVKLPRGWDHHSYIHQSSPHRLPQQCCTSTCLHPEASKNPPLFRVVVGGAALATQGKAFRCQEVPSGSKGMLLLLYVNNRYQTASKKICYTSYTGGFTNNFFLLFQFSLHP